MDPCHGLCIFVTNEMAPRAEVEELVECLTVECLMVVEEDMAEDGTTCPECRRERLEVVVNKVVAAVVV